MPRTSVTSIAARCAAGSPESRAIGFQCRKWRTPVRTIVAPGVIGDGHDIGVAHRAAGLDEGRHAGRKTGLDARPGTGRTRRTHRRRPSSRPGRAWRWPSRRPAARRRRGDVWPLPIPTSRRSRTSDDGVRGHAADEPPGEVEVALLLRRSGPPRGARPRRWIVRGDVRRGHEDGAAGGPDRSRSDRARRRPLASSVAGQRSSRSTRRFGLVASTSSASASNAGATTISRKIETSRSAIGRSTGRVSATTPPNALTGSASSAASQASRSDAALRGAARVGVLDDDDGRPAQGPSERRGGGGVEHVVVREGLALERAALHAEQPVAEVVPGRR